MCQETVSGTVTIPLERYDKLLLSEKSIIDAEIFFVRSHSMYNRGKSFYPIKRDDMIDEMSATNAALSQENDQLREKFIAIESKWWYKLFS